LNQQRKCTKKNAGNAAAVNLNSFKIIHEMLGSSRDIDGNQHINARGNYSARDDV
jgi:hypothetical protein